MSELGETLGRAIREQTDMKQSLVVQGNAPVWFQRFSQDLNIYPTMAISTKDLGVSNGLIWNHPIQGFWGSYNWMTVDSFILGHVDYAILGTSPLGGVFGPLRQHVVISRNNTFYEQLNSEYLIDTTISTGTITTSDGVCVLGTTEVLRSKIIAKNNVAYTTVTLSVEGVNTSLLSASVSLDAGSTWNSIVLDTITTFSNTSVEGVIYNIASSGGTATIDLVKIAYA